MLTIFNKLKNKNYYSLVVTIAGIIIGITIKSIMTNLALLNFGILIILTCVFIIVSIYFLGKTNKEISEKLNMFGLTSEWIFGKDHFKRATETINNAEKEILVIGMYFPSKPTIEIKMLRAKKREKYLKAIEQCIKNKIKESGTNNFSYKRILPLDDPALNKSEIREDMIPEYPLQISNHYKQLEIILDKAVEENIEVLLYYCNPIPSLPSILIVDRKFAYLTMPTISSQYSNKKHIILSGSLYFEDRSGEQISTWASEIEKIIDNSQSVKKIIN